MNGVPKISFQLLPEPAGRRQTATSACALTALPIAAVRTRLTIISTQPVR
jgi:hypothetical protein